jgi:hypothetical protein
VQENHTPQVLFYHPRQPVGGGCGRPIFLGPVEILQFCSGFRNESPWLALIGGRIAAHSQGHSGRAMHVNDSDTYSQARVGRIVGVTLGSLWLLMSLLAAAAVDASEARDVASANPPSVTAHAAGNESGTN